ncbi:hypothetical protein D3C81_2208610 [compost metagenome]
MVAKCRTYSCAHPDIHSAVAGYHDEGDIVANMNFAAALQFIEGIDHTGQGSCTVLEQVVYEGLVM